MAGLFNLPSPEQVRSGVQQRLFSQGVGRGAAGGATALGAALGQGVASLFGRQNPEAQRAAGIQAIAKDVQSRYGETLSNPQDILKMSQELGGELIKGGFQTEGFNVMQQAVQMRNSLPKTKPAEIFSKIDIEKFTSESIGEFQRTGDRSKLEVRPPDRSKSLSIGEKAIDKKFAPVFVEWTTGGSADVEKNLLQLKSAAKRLGSGKENLTGAILGNTPDLVRQQTHPASIDVRDEVEEVVQRNLRLILGAQFTQREGERLIARAYNERLDEKVNAKRVKRLITAIQKAAKAKEAAIQYFNKNNTLSGFEGPGLSQKSLEDSFMSDLSGLDDEPAKEKARRTGQGGRRSNQDKQALKWARNNPDDPRAGQIKQRLGIE